MRYFQTLCLYALATLSAGELQLPDLNNLGTAAGIPAQKKAFADSIIVFKKEPELEKLKKIGAELMTLANMYFIAGNWTDKIIEELKATGLVDYIEPDYECRTQLAESTQKNPPSWGLARITKKDLPLSKTFEYAESAGHDVNVYIIDTGINLDHEDIRGRAVWGKSIGNLPKKDDHGHGTFVAGIVGGTIHGVAKKAKLIAVKALDSQGAGPTSDVLRALQWVLKKHKRSKNKKTVVNLSLDAPFSQSLNDAVRNSVSEGITIVTAAGNGDENGNPQDACNYSPASSEDSITVGATTVNDKVASFSNYGKCVTMFAPGVEIESITHDTNNGVKLDDGTSFAAPYVAGAVALLFSEYGPMSAKEVKARLLEKGTASSVGGLTEKKEETPNILLNVRAASNPDKVSSDAGKSRLCLGVLMFLLVICSY